MDPRVRIGIALAVGSLLTSTLGCGTGQLPLTPGVDFDTETPTQDVSTGNRQPTVIVPPTVAAASETAAPGQTPDPLVLLEKAEQAMGALDSYDQHVYAAEQPRHLSEDADPLWELWDTEYRHEKPDRMRIVVRTAWIGEDDVYRKPSVSIHIGEHTWSRGLPAEEDAPWTCTEGGVTEMPRFFLAPSDEEIAEYVGLERIGGRALHVMRVSQADDDVDETPEPPQPVSDQWWWERVIEDKRYWIHPETFRVIRIETDSFEDGRMAITEVRTYGEFNTPSEIEPPGPCVIPTSEVVVEEPVDPDLFLARERLVRFHDDMHKGHYASAADLYGGSYDVLRDWNPTVDPDDHPALLASACANQLRCLAVRQLTGGEEVAPKEFAFTVEYETPDGDVFVLGPCCGADATETPPQSEFECRVVVVDDRTVKVMCLPPYVP